MSVRLVREVMDDIDGSVIPLEDEHESLVVFGVGKQQYEVHLNEANREKFHELLQVYVENARPHKSKKPSHKKTPTQAKTQIDMGDLPARSARHQRPGLKKWAEAAGYGKITGRASAAVNQAYDQAHK